jgi:hypothetical protein
LEHFPSTSIPGVAVFGAYDNRLIVVFNKRIQLVVVQDCFIASEVKIPLTLFYPTVEHLFGISASTTTSDNDKLVVVRHGRKQVFCTNSKVV